MENNDQLEQRIAKLEIRVASLEVLAGCDHRLSVETSPNGRSGWNGSILYRGNITSHRERIDVENFQEVEKVVGLLESVPNQLVQLFKGMSHPLRLTLLLHLLEGPKNRQQLQEALGASSPGQLSHHLQELYNAGIIQQGGRSLYILPSSSIVPILIMIAVVSDLSEKNEDKSKSKKSSYGLS